jgi:hypothetical protein
MRRFIYAPDVQIYIGTTYNGVIDVSQDVISGSVHRVLDGVSTATMQLQNPKFKYTRDKHGRPVFRAMDRIVISLQRIYQPMQIFSGYLDEVPYEQFVPGPVTLNASCTLKRLLYTWFDPGLLFVTKKLEEFGWFYDSVNGALTDPATGFGGMDIGGGLGELMQMLLVEVGGWTPETIKVEALPKGFLDKTVSIMQGQMAGLQHELDKVDGIVKQLMTSEGIQPGQQGVTGGTGGRGKAGIGGAAGGTVVVPNGVGVCKVLGYAAHELGQPYVWGHEDETEGFDCSGLMQFIWNKVGIHFGGRTAQAQYGTGDLVPMSGGDSWWDNMLPADLVFFGYSENDIRHVALYIGNGQMIHAANHRDGVIASSVTREDGVYPWHGAKRIIEGGCVGTPSGNSAGTQAGGQAGRRATMKDGVIVWQDNGKPAGGDALAAWSQQHPNSGFPKEGAVWVVPGATSATGATKGTGGTPTNLNNVPEHTIFGYAQLAQIWKNAGGKPDMADVMAAIALAESGGDVSSWNPHPPDDSYGLWQINYYGNLREERTKSFGDPKKLLTDPIATARAAVAISGNSPLGLHNWSTWLNKDESSPQSYLYWLYAKHDVNPSGSTVPSNIQGGVVTPGTGGTGGTAGTVSSPQVQLGEGTTVGGAIENANSVVLGTQILFPTVSSEVGSELFTGERALYNDVSLIKWIQTACTASGRKFMSMPNGDFVAFYPDYFRWDETNDTIMDIRDIEIVSGNITFTDQELTTHYFTTIDIDLSGSISFDDEFRSLVASVESPEIFESLVNTPVGFDPAVFLQRYGARPLVDVQIDIKNPVVQYLYGWTHFLLKWSKLFQCELQTTFLPEIYPGMLVQLVSKEIQLFVEGVTHSWDRESGFSTSMELVAPSTTDASTNPWMIVAGNSVTAPTSDINQNVDIPHGVQAAE